MELSRSRPDIDGRVDATLMACDETETDAAERDSSIPSDRADAASSPSASSSFLAPMS